MAKTKAQARKERLARVRAEQKREQRRHAIVIWGVVAVVVVVLVGLVAYQLIRGGGGDEGGIEGVRSFEDLSRDHVAGQISYEQTPPVGGQHNDTWLNCGVYDEPVPNENAVHSLEHGAVWITYRPGLPGGQVERLRGIAGGEQFVVLSPYDGLPSPVVASAWGTQLRLQNADDSRLEDFIREYQQGPQTPERGAPCTGGVGVPLSE